MANDNVPRGLVPLNWPNMPVHAYRVSTAADIYLGQPVQSPAAGYVVGIGTMTGVTQCIGVAVGFAGTLKRGLATNDPFLDVSDLTPPTPASDTGDRYVFVADNPNQEFVAQEDTGGTALTLAEAGAAVDMLFRGAGANVVTGNDDTGWATSEIDASSVVTTTGAFLRLSRLHDVVNADGTENAVGDFGKWIVTILHHQNKGAPVLPIV